MALIKCHECRHAVSTEATACPNCGAKPRAPAVPRKKAAPIPQIFVGVIVVLGVVGWLASGNDDGRAAAAEAAKAAACIKDLQCWGDRNSPAAESRCPDGVERLALHSVRWRDGAKMTRFRWKDQAAGTLTYLGDKAEFQNGFGAFTPMTYECDFDPRTKTVLDVRASEGRLP